MFRGYLQRQFQALWGNPALAITAQAVIFGISHGYQGLRNVLVIAVFGALFGILAHWRRSLAPGMAAHAWTDIVAGSFPAPRRLRLRSLSNVSVRVISVPSPRSFQPDDQRSPTTRTSRRKALPILAGVSAASSMTTTVPLAASRS